MSRQHILVVDDEADILELIAYSLSADGFEVTCVQDGKEALKVAVEKRPDLILLDWMLPGMNGLEITRQLKSDPQTAPVPIIMQTVKDADADIALGLEMGGGRLYHQALQPPRHGGKGESGSAQSSGSRGCE